ncbi:MAG: VOC family protein [Jiangellaceae bacterium]
MRIRLATIFVDDQDKAREFYSEKLGLRVTTDESYGDERWLTVAADDGGAELLLAHARDAAKAFQVATYQAGKPALSLASDDCAAEAEALTSRGVPFTLEPTVMPYGGVDAVFEDGCGNLVNLHQKPPAPGER